MGWTEIEYRNRGQAINQAPGLPSDVYPHSFTNVLQMQIKLARLFWGNPYLAKKLKLIPF